MGVFRVHKTKNYTTMSNYHFSDIRLSLKAVGLLSKMLSLPDDWNYSIEGLAAICKDGKDSIRSALKELEECGYVRRTREHDEQGRFRGYNYDIFETPHEASESEENQDVVPSSEIPTTVNPMTENPTQLNTNKQNTNKQTTTTKKESLSVYLRAGQNDHVLIDAKELQRLDAVYGIERVRLMMQRLDYHINKTGTYYPNHAEVIEKWIEEDEARLLEKMQT